MYCHGVTQYRAGRYTHRTLQSGSGVTEAPGRSGVRDQRGPHSGSQVTTRRVHRLGRSRRQTAAPAAQCASALSDRSAVVTLKWDKVQEAATPLVSSEQASSQ